MTELDSLADVDALASIVLSAAPQFSLSDVSPTMTFPASGALPNFLDTSHFAHSSTSTPRLVQTRSTPPPYLGHFSSRSPAADSGRFDGALPEATIPPSSSPSSANSSPYVPPRLHVRVLSDSAVPAGHAPGFRRRGAVSGASGPLPFPPAPMYASDVSGDGTEVSRRVGPENGSLDSSSHPSIDDRIPLKTLSSSCPAFTLSVSQPGQRLSPDSHSPTVPSVASSSSSVLASNLLDSARLSIPIPPSSYSVPDAASSGKADTADGILPSPSSILGLKHGRPTPSSSVGGYWAAASADPEPYRPDSGHVGSLVAGYEHKHASVNPPPRKFQCCICPARFSRGHDLNR